MDTRQIRRRGEDVQVWNRTHAKAQALEADGARFIANSFDGDRETLARLPVQRVRGGLVRGRGDAGSELSHSLLRLFHEDRIPASSPLLGGEPL